MPADEIAPPPRENMAGRGVDHGRLSFEQAEFYKVVSVAACASSALSGESPYRQSAFAVAP
jgi:hypothetical protein